MTSKPPTKPLRASLLVRLSREAGESNRSLKGMMTDLRRLARTNGWEIVAEHEDEGVSGAVRDRPGFRAWLEDGRSGRADVLLAPHADRLTREGVNALAMVLDVVEGKNPETGKVERTPVRLVTADGLDSERDEEAFRFRFVLAAEVARSERARIAARNKGNKRRLAEAHRWGGGTRPYGYRPEPAPDGRGKVLVPVPEEAEVVRRIADEILAGRSLYSIAARLNEDRIPSATGGTWSRASVRKLARSEHVLGRLTRQGKALRDEETGAPVTPFPPLLDLDTAERVRALTESTPTPGRSEATIAGRRKRASRLLSGLLSCSCGAPLVVRRRKGIAYYGCADRARGQGSGTRCLLVDAERVEAAVTDRFLADFGRLPVVERIVRQSAVPGLAEAERDLAEAAAAIPTTPADDLPALLAKVTRLSKTRDRLAAQTTPPDVEWLSTGETFAERWERLQEVADRRHLLDLSGVVVTVHPARRRGFWDPERVAVTVPEDYESPADYGDGNSRGPRRRAKA